MSGKLKEVKMDRAINICLWVLLAAIWSSSYAIIKFGVETIDPSLLVLGRLVIAAIILSLIMALQGARLERSWSAWAAYALTGIVGTSLPFFLITFGELNVSSSLAAILMGVAPIASVVIAHFALAEEPLTLRSGIGVLIGFVGLIVLFGFEALSSLGAHVIGQAALVGAALCYALNTIVVKRLPKRKPIEMAAGSMIVGAVSIALFTFLTVDISSQPTPSAASLIAVIFLGFVPTAFAMLVFFYLVTRIEAKQMSQINFAVPIGGAIVGVVWLGEELAVNQIVALPIIILAIYMVSSRPALRAAGYVSGNKDVSG